MSSLPKLVQCPGFHITRQADDRGVGAAAHTGTAIGRVVELWHLLGGAQRNAGLALEEALGTARSEADEFALADWDSVRHWGLLYAQDPRNRDPQGHDYYGVVVPELLEAEVTLTLDPDPDDTTGDPIVLVGHVDQIRRDAQGHKRVWDLKAGRGSGDSMVLSYSLQLAAYALACTETLGETVLPGGIVRLRGYDAKGRGKGYEPDEFPVFFEANWSLDACRSLLATVAYTVGELRRGIVRVQPGDQCRYCPGGGPGECHRAIDAALADLTH